MMADVIDEIRAERQRQLVAEGWSHDHDDKHDKGELARAASCYCDPNPTMSPGSFMDVPYEAPTRWPWGWDWWKPSERRRDLVKAGALIVAEIERLDRATPPAELGEDGT